MVIQIFVLTLATIFPILLIIGCILGSKYSDYVSWLDADDDYPLNNLYIVGFALADLAPFRLRGKLATSLKQQARILYDDKTFEHYANARWAQFITLSLLVVCAVMPLLWLMGLPPAFVLIVAVMIVAIMWNEFLNKMSNILKKRAEDCVSELPNMISKLSLLINSGMVLREAWKIIAYGKEGELYTLMRKTCEMLENNESDVAALHHFGVISSTPEIKKFASAIIQGLEKGNAGLVDFLIAQSSELWGKKRQNALRQGEIAAGKLVAPIGLMFGGVIIIIISAAMQSFSF